VGDGAHDALIERDVELVQLRGDPVGRDQLRWAQYTRSLIDPVQPARVVRQNIAQGCQDHAHLLTHRFSRAQAGQLEEPTPQCDVLGHAIHANDLTVDQDGDVVYMQLDALAVLGEQRQLIVLSDASRGCYEALPRAVQLFGHDKAARQPPYQFVDGVAGEFGGCLIRRCDPTAQVHVVHRVGIAREQRIMALLQLREPAFSLVG